MVNRQKPERVRNARGRVQLDLSFVRPEPSRSVRYRKSLRDLFRRACVCVCV